MLQPAGDPGDRRQPSLRSGMYILRCGPEESCLVVYWPEDTTWDDNCASSVQKNRITFMRYVPLRHVTATAGLLLMRRIRYLSKIADQVVCLMSDEHAEAVVWRQDDVDSDSDSLDDETDRLFAFEVSKTNEQEENVTAQPGFEVSCGNKLRFV